MSTQRHIDGADGARPKHSALARQEFILLAPEATEETEEDPASVGNQGIGDSPEDSTGSGGTDKRQTGT